MIFLIVATVRIYFKEHTSILISPVRRLYTSEAPFAQAEAHLQTRDQKNNWELQNKLQKTRAMRHSPPVFSTRS